VATNAMRSFGSTSVMNANELIAEFTGQPVERLILG
jgi:hypothetical protein